MILRELIYSALRLAQVTEQGEYSSDTQIENEAILCLQSLVSSWSAQDILQPFSINENFELTINKNEYSIGKGAEFDTLVPERFISIFVRTSDDMDIPVKLISHELYYKINFKHLKATQYPYLCYYKYGYPIGTLFFWPMPQENYKVYFSSYKNYEWVTVESLDVDIPLPTPYLSALKYNLALEICSEYLTPVPPAVSYMASQTLINIGKFTHKVVPRTQYDVGPSPYEWGGYDFYEYYL